MMCPACKIVKLLAAERDGVEIDYCPKCRGIWLQHGELEKMLQKERDLATEEPVNNTWLKGVFDMFSE